MYKDLSSGVKSSITRSISTAFEAYMASIEWDEARFDMADFMLQWQRYIRENASWFDKVDAALKSDPAFHEELAVRINAVIQKLLSEPPSEEQMASIAMLQEELGTHVKYGCKAEAAYLELALKQKRYQA